MVLMKLVYHPLGIRKSFGIVGFLSPFIVLPTDPVKDNAVHSDTELSGFFNGIKDLFLILIAFLRLDISKAPLGKKRRLSGKESISGHNLVHISGYEVIVRFLIRFSINVGSV